MYVAFLSERVNLENYDVVPRAQIDNAWQMVAESEELVIISVTAAATADGRTAFALVGRVVPTGFEPVSPPRECPRGRFRHLR